VVCTLRRSADSVNFTPAVLAHAIDCWRIAGGRHRSLGYAVEGKPSGASEGRACGSPTTSADTNIVDHESDVNGGHRWFLLLRDRDSASLADRP
jgi:hypothetical protein